MNHSFALIYIIISLLLGCCSQRQSKNSMANTAESCPVEETTASVIHLQYDKPINGYTVTADVTPNELGTDGSAELTFTKGDISFVAFVDFFVKDGFNLGDIDKNSPYSVFKGTQLKGKTLGILGYGSIGKRVGRIARAFGMALLIYDPYVGEVDVEEIGVKKADTVEEVMRNADFITCHMKVTESTKGIVSRERIAMMKPTAYFINCSRGAVLDEQALIEALRERRIAGAAFDVYASEPIASNHPYITELDNVVITPHIGGATEEVLANHTRQVVSDVRRFLAGEPMLYQWKG